MEKKSLKDYRDLVLEDKRIEIKPIIRRKPFLKKDHDGHHTYTGCSKDMGLPYDPKARSYVNPFFNIDEQEAFEVLLNQEEGSLNLYKYNITKPNFWGDFLIKIPKEGLKLNLMNPADALRYRIILKDPKFAKNAQEVGIAEKLYEIVNEQEKREQISALGKKREKANDYMHEIKGSKTKMANVLKLLGKDVDHTHASLEFLKTELFDIIAETDPPKGMPGLDKFLEVIDDPVAETKVFVLDAIKTGEIKRTQNGYIYGSKHLGVDYNQVVNYFLDKDPKVQQLKLIIEERLKNNKEL